MIERSELIVIRQTEMNQPMTTDQLIDAVRAWGIAKGITGPDGKGTLLGQLTKSTEELTETRDAAVMWLHGHEWMSNKKGEMVETKVELKDGLGDLVVTAILAAEMAGLRIEDCLAAAYDEIKGRTGSMVGGVFVKNTPGEKGVADE